MSASSSPPSPLHASLRERRFVRTIGLYHFAYLRGRRRSGRGRVRRATSAPSMGMGMGMKPARRTSRPSTPSGAITRRRSEPWRLVGLSIRTTCTQQQTLATLAEGRLEGFTDADAQHLATLLPATAPPVRPRIALAAIDFPAPASTLILDPGVHAVPTQ